MAEQLTEARHELAELRRETEASQNSGVVSLTHELPALSGGFSTSTSGATGVGAMLEEVLDLSGSHDDAPSESSEDSAGFEDNKEMTDEDKRRCHLSLNSDAASVVNALSGRLIATFGLYSGLKR